MTIEDLRNTNVPEIYGDVTVNYDGLSLLVADKNALDLIRLAALKEPDTTPKLPVQHTDNVSSTEARVPALLTALARLAS
jgi:hypothetical protein